MTRTLQPHPQSFESSSSHSSREDGKRDPTWEQHWPILFLTVSMGLALVMLEIRSNGAVGLRGGHLPDLPSVCLSRRLFGFDCPGCGLTRSLVSLARGDLAASWNYHRLGWVVALGALAQFLYRIFVLVQWRRGRVVSSRWLDFLGLAVVALLVVNWCWPG